MALLTFREQAGEDNADSITAQLRNVEDLLHRVRSRWGRDGEGGGSGLRYLADKAAALVMAAEALHSDLEFATEEYEEGALEQAHG